MDAAEFRVEGKKMIDIVADYWDTLREKRKPLSDVKPGYITSLVPEKPPSMPEEWSKIYDDLEKVIFNGSTHWHHPNFHAYFPTGQSYHSIMADILSAGISSISFTWIAGPSSTELEKSVLDWLVVLLDLPPIFKNSHPGPGCGIIQSTASEATLIAVFTARASKVEQIKREPTWTKWITDTDIGKKLKNLLSWNNDKRKEIHEPHGIITPYYHDPSVFIRFVMYFCDQAHSSVEKAAMLSGVRYRKLKGTREYLGNYGLDPDVLEDAIKEDKAKGYIPFMLVTTLGTTTTCGVDQIDRLGPICQREGLYLHVDAAYAGAFTFSEEFRYLIKGLEYVDSYNFNMHKAGMTTFDCSPMWFKNGTYASRYFNIDAVYLSHEYQSTSTDFRHLEIPLGRRFRSLKLWFLLRNYGVEKVKAYQKKTVDLAKEFSILIIEDGRFELFVPVHLGLVAFRLKHHTNADNEKLSLAITKDRRIHMVPSTVHGTFILRFVVSNQHTNSQDILFARNVIYELTDQLFKK